MPDFTTRSRHPEQMENPDLAREVLEQTLDDLAYVNAATAGYVPSFSGIDALVPDHLTEISVLDVGCGNGDFLRRFVDRADRMGLEVRATGTDLSEPTIDYARRCTNDERITFEVGDLLRLSERRRWDVVHTALTLHHLSNPEIIDGIRRMWRASRFGVVVNDLHRHPIGYYGARIVLMMLSNNEVTRHDGAVSVLRGFRRRELRDFGCDAVGVEPHIRWWPLFRWQMLLPGPGR